MQGVRDSLIPDVLDRKDPVRAFERPEYLSGCCLEWLSCLGTGVYALGRSGIIAAKSSLTDNLTMLIHIGVIYKMDSIFADALIPFDTCDTQHHKVCPGSRLGVVHANPVSKCNDYASSMYPETPNVDKWLC